MAYFDQEVSLKDMIQHIYEGKSVMRTNDRPNLFVKELKMYVDYLKNTTNQIRVFPISLHLGVVY